MKAELCKGEWAVGWSTHFYFDLSSLPSSGQALSRRTPYLGSEESQVSMVEILHSAQNASFRMTGVLFGHEVRAVFKGLFTGLIPPGE
jgi:hypothetical protein